MCDTCGVTNIKDVFLKKIDIKKLILFGFITESIYLLFYFVEDLYRTFQPFSSYVEYDVFHVLTLISVFLGVFYVLTYRGFSFSKITYKCLILFPVIFNLTLLPLQPMMSSDLYTYISRARVVSKYEENPYVVPYSLFKDDSLYNDIATGWAEKTAIYGPLFVEFTSVLTLLAGDGLVMNIYSIKFAFVILNLINMFLVKKITNDKRAVFLYSWNPLINLEFALNSHNDVIMITFFLFGLVFLLKKKRYLGDYLGAWFFFFVSVVIKLFTAIFIPFICMHVLSNLSGLKEKICFIIWVIAVSSILIVVPMLPFWSGTDTFSRLLEVVQMNNILTAPGMLIFVAALFIVSFPVDGIYFVSKAISRAGFVLFYIYLIIKSLWDKHIRTQNTLLWYLLVSSSVFFMFFISRFFSWYLTLLITIITIYIGKTKEYDLKLYLQSVTFYGLLAYLFIR